jgi:Raf kinase inhibitor-like YbhB/YbcL family protein
MKLISKSISHNEPVPGRCAFAVQGDPIDFSDNKNPHVSWVDVPNDAESLVLICHDPDVPSKPDDVNKEDREVPADLERMDFHHWVLVDIDPEIGQIEAGEFSSEVTARGKDGPEGPKGTRQGINDYTNWFEGDPDMEGTYFGYDGPCPPWNDSIVHHYHFTLYATDLEEIPVSGEFTGQDVLDAIDGHVLDKSKVVGTYSLNPDVEA